MRGVFRDMQLEVPSNLAGNFGDSAGDESETIFYCLLVEKTPIVQIIHMDIGKGTCT
jgi:hypothetical protein